VTAAPPTESPTSTPPPRSPRPAEARFTGRVDDYERGRPGYPPALVDAVIELAGLEPGATLADLGAGTGLASAPFLARGFRVLGVEPNAAMRAAAERRFAGEPRFAAVEGRAEATGLADASADLALAAQAFHWFEPGPTRRELRRILRPPRPVALVWNARRAEGTPFLEAYERLLETYGTDYREVGHRGVGEARVAAFLGGPVATRRFDNAQRLGLEGLRARLLSSSYVPAVGEPRHDEMLAELAALFARHARPEPSDAAGGGTVEVLYDCELFVGRLGG
jgi:SAM-dependent methyltransferase